MKHTLTDADRLELKARLIDLCANGNVHVKCGDKEERAMLVSNDLLDEFVRVFSDFYESKNTFTDAISQPEEEVEEHDFKGVAYEKDIDQKALQHGFYKVFEFMATHPDQWFLDTEIAAHTGVYVPSVQRYRSYMREPEFGGHTVERRRRAGCRIFEYRLIPNKDSKIWRKVDALDIFGRIVSENLTLSSSKVTGFIHNS